jgi:hypothetical protein
MLSILNFFPKSCFLNDVSQSHVIYHFEKCATISWDCDTSFENQLLEKKFRMSSISPFFFLSQLLFITHCCPPAPHSSLLFPKTESESKKLDFFGDGWGWPIIQ